MAMKLCRECGQQVSDKAKSCPSCGISDPVQKPWHNRPISGPIGCVGLLIFAGLCFMMIDGGGGGSSSPQPEHSDVAAWVMCQEFVEDQLKAPGTADFPAGYTRYTTDLGGGRYRVQAYVDAENAFGANVRTDFDCTVAYVGSDNWRLENLDFSPR